MASRASSRWERVQRARGAAAYAGYANEAAFLSAVADGSMPPPFELCGAPAWDIADLDASIDAIKAGARPRRRWQEQAPARV